MENLPRATEQQLLAVAQLASASQTCKIYFLVFTSYGRNYAIIPNSHLRFTQVALCLQSTQSAELVNCSFHDNLGTALRVDNTNITLAGNSEFTHNYILCGANFAGGGGIIAFSSTLTFTGNTPSLIILHLAQ